MPVVKYVVKIVLGYFEIATISIAIYHNDKYITFLIPCINI